MPAKAKGAWLPGECSSVVSGRRAAPTHSIHQRQSIQRRCRNAGFSATVSARALRVLYSVQDSLVHTGTKPHFNSGRLTTTLMGLRARSSAPPGATL